nr:unnamed protein product [Callosobruchus chinensis]
MELPLNLTTSESPTKDGTSARWCSSIGCRTRTRTEPGSTWTSTLHRDSSSPPRTLYT